MPLFMKTNECKPLTQGERAKNPMRKAGKTEINRLKSGIKTKQICLYIAKRL
jgi:hypothetical protein